MDQTDIIKTHTHIRKLDAEKKRLVISMKYFKCTFIIGQLDIITMLKAAVYLSWSLPTIIMTICLLLLIVPFLSDTAH